MPQIRLISGARWSALLFLVLGLAATAPRVAIAAEKTASKIDVVEGAWFNTSFPIPVMHLEGTIEEVARQHGLLAARHPGGRDTLAYLAGVVDHKLASNPRLAKHPVLRGAAKWVYRHFIRNPMVDHLPERYLNAYAEYAKAAGVPEDEVLDALVLPDAALRLVSLLYNTEAAPMLPDSFGCTSIIWNAGPESVLHGRNLDYDGVGYWDKNQVIMHVIPSSADGLAYVAVAALGVHAPGITAFNETGLTLAMHQLTFNDSRSNGTPMPVIAAEIIRNARTIDDAIAIIRGFPRAGGWAYVLSQGRDRAVVEASASDVAIRRSSEPFFFQTNHVSSPALSSLQIFYSPGSWLDSFERAETLAKEVSSGEVKGWATPERVAALLGDHGKPARVAGGTITKLDNIQSVIMDASHRRLWISKGDADSAPNEDNYLEYRWSDLRSADPPELTGAEVSLVPEDELGPLGARLREILRKASSQADPDARPRLLAEYASRVEQHVSGDVPPAGTWSGLYLGAWQLLHDGPADPATATRALHLIDLALKDPGLNEIKTAVAAAEAARHRVALGRFTRARILDLLGHRSEALFEYVVVERSAGFARLKSAATKGLKSRFGWKQARSIAVDWAGIDLYSY
jgi:hypothetical protein